MDCVRGAHIGDRRQNVAANADSNEWETAGLVLFI